MTEETKTVDTPQESEPEVVTDEITPEQRAAVVEANEGKPQEGETAKKQEESADSNEGDDKKEKSGEEEQPKADDKQAKPEKRNRRLQRKVRRLHSENDELRAENERLKEQARSLQSSKNADDGTTQERPKQEDFETYQEYEDALIDWRIDQRSQQSQPETKPEPTKDDKSESDTSSQTEQEIIDELFTDGSEKYADFKDVVQNPNLPVTKAMFDAIVDSESPEDVLYHIAQDVELAREMSEMSPTQVAREIGRIEAIMSASSSNPAPQKGSSESKDEPPKPAKKVSSAPDPINPIGESNDTPSRDPDDMSMDEYETMRRKQEQRSRGYY